MKMNTESLARKVLASLATIAFLGMLAIGAAGFEQKALPFGAAGSREILSADGYNPPPQLPTKPPKAVS